MKTRVFACVLALAAVTSGRGADVAKQVHDAVRDLLDLKTYAWRESREQGPEGKGKIVLVASGRSEVDGFSVGLCDLARIRDVTFTNLGPRTAFKVGDRWKEIDEMDADELKATLGRTMPPTRSGSTKGHWNFVAPHDVLVALVGTAPAPDWIGDRIVGIISLDAAPALYQLLHSRGEIDWAWTPPLVRNKLGGVVPAPAPVLSDARKEAIRRRYEETLRGQRAEYEMWLRDGLVARVIIRLEIERTSPNGSSSFTTRENWIFDFSEVGRVDVAPESAAKALLSAN